MKSAERALALLELAAEDRGALTVGQAWRALAIPQASASVLLGSLRALGYLAYDRRRRTYAPTIRVALLGASVGAHLGARLCDALRDLHERLDLSAFLAFQNEAVAQYVLVLSRQEGRASPSGRLVDQRLLSLCAAGRVLLSDLPDREVLGWAHRCGAEAAADEPRISGAELLRIVRQVRDKGYADTGAEARFHHGTLAVLVTGRSALPPLALGVGTPSLISETDRERIVAELRQAASRLI